MSDCGETGNCFAIVTVVSPVSTPDEHSEDGEPHTSAATAFVRRVNERDIEALESLILFGSTARNEATGLKSDVDFLAVVSDDSDKSTVRDELHDIAYDVMLEYGPVVEVHVFSRSAFDQRRDHPFVRRAVRDGEIHV
jgi:predicted nucleotidyltransferase